MRCIHCFAIVLNAISIQEVGQLHHRATSNTEECISDVVGTPRESMTELLH